MNCIITGEQTNSKTNNIPLSIVGRNILNKVVEKHNERTKEMFIAAAMEQNPALTKELLEKLSPKFNKSQILRLLDKKEKDVMESLAQIME